MSKLFRKILVVGVLFGLLTGMGLGAVIPVRAATSTVNRTGDSGGGSLRWAIGDAGVGGTVTFDPKLSGQTIYLDSSLVITQDVMIDGSGLAVPITISGDSGGDGTGDVRVFYVNPGVTLSLVNVTITKGLCHGCNGAGIFNDGGALNLTNVTVSENQALSDGYGGGVYSRGTLNIQDSVFSNNFGDHDGGGLLINSGNATITNSSFDGNQVNLWGGGGILINDGTVNISNSTISNNSAGYHSGGMYIQAGTLSLANTTMSGNDAPWGAAINTSAAITVVNSTIADNIASDGQVGGIRVFSWSGGTGVVSLANTILANNTGDNCGTQGDGYFTNAGANLTWGDSTCPGTNANPLLGALGDYGGPSTASGQATQTIPLLPRSAAIDAGNSATCAASPVNSLDQRGVMRIGTCDIGAYEVQTILFAKPGGLTTGMCGNWDTACELNYALPRATSGQEIWVAAGTYKPTSAGDRSATFQLINGVSVYGGFAGTETFRAERNATVNLTILSGDLLGNDSGFTNNTENSYHVISGATGAIMDGFIITGGNANGTTPDGYGGGMINVSSSPTLSNITFRGNAAAYGGGMLNNSSSPALTHVTFSDNSASIQAGGMYNLAGSAPTLENVTFSGNLSTNEGGGMLNWNSNPTLTNVTFHGNSGSVGGAMRNDASSPIVRNGIFWGNMGGEFANVTSASVPDIQDSIVMGGCPSGANCSNIISTDPQLGTPGSYGGQTQSFPLLPGSAAIDAGNAADCPLTDQRGVSRVGNCDIGAFESQGFTLAITGGDGQSIPVNGVSKNPLTLTVSSAFGEPVDGGKITFTAPDSGASLNPDTQLVTISAGAVSQRVMVNSSLGAYSVTASAAGASSSVSFSLTNIATPAPQDATADMVYGQGNVFNTNTANKGGVSADSILSPYAPAFDSSGNMYMPDNGNNRVLYYPAGSTTATRVYGQGGSFSANTANTGGISADSLSGPAGVILDSSDNLYVADYTNNRVLFYPAGSTTATRVYGQGGGFSTNTVNAGGISANSLSGPLGIVLDASDNLYVVDKNNHRVLFYPVGSTTATRVYGQGGSFTTNTSNKGGISANSLSDPRGIALDASGNLYVADRANNRVLYFAAGSTTATRVYGQGGVFTVNTANNGGVSAASLNSPYDVEVDGSGNLYVADRGNNRVLYYPAGDTTASAVYGQGGSFSTNSSNNGGINASSLAGPTGMALDASGSLYISDFTNNRVLKYGSESACAAVGTVVSNNADSGAGSLRQAMLDACSGATITFDNDYTITLASQLLAAKSLTIDGAGHSITVSGNNAVRVFSINPGITFSVNELAIVNGIGSGAGIYSPNTNSTVNVSGSSFSGNAATSGSSLSGAAIYSAGTLNITGSTFSDNLAGGSNYGGAIFIPSGTVTITNSAFSNNTSDFGGAIYSRGALTIDGSTFNGNRAVGGYGGGIYAYSGTATVTNSTFYGNTAGFGGAIVTYYGNATVANCTFVGNNGPTSGGIQRASTGTFTIQNSFLVRGTGPNCVGSLSGSNNLSSDGNCSSGAGFTTSSNILPGTLGDYGGQTQTIPLLPGSSAIDTGNAANCPTTDQRGNARVGTCDIGAFESQGFTLAKTGGDNQVTTASTVFANPLTLTVASSGREPVDGGTVTFTAPASGASLNPVTQTAAISGGAISQLVTANSSSGNYSVAASAAGASSDAIFSLANRNLPTVTTNSATSINLYTATLNAAVNANNASTNVFFEYGLTTSYGSSSPATIVTGTTSATVSQVISGLTANTTYHYRVTASNLIGTALGSDKTFTTSCAAAITVSNNADSGAGSLRQAVQDVCASGTITFGGDYTITLTSPVIIPRTMTINGAGRSIVVSGNNVSRVFTVNSSVTFNLQNITASRGGVSNAGTFNATNVTFTENTGNAIYSNPGTVNLVNTTVSNNTSDPAIFQVGAMTVNSSTFSGNTGGSYGAIYFYSGTGTVTNSTFAGNAAGISIYISTVSLTNSTLSNTNRNIKIGSTSATLTAKNVILVKGSSNCYYQGGSTPSQFSGGNNLADDSTCGSIFPNSASILTGAAGNYSSSLATIPLLPGSAAINAGDAAACPSTDQRGMSRVGACDIGAFESQGFTLTKTSGDGQSTAVNTAFTNPFVLAVTSTAGEPVDGGNVTFTAPVSGASLTATTTSATIVAGAVSQPVTANGIIGGPYNVIASAAGAANINFALTNTCGSNITVSNANDSGAGSLRQALADICSGGMITFNGDYTITLASQLTIAKSLTVDGVGHTVTVSGNNAVRVFTVNSGVISSLQNLTVANGNCVACNGGGIYNNGGTLNLASVTLSGNRATNDGYGGGIYNLGTLNIQDSTLTGNIGDHDGGAIQAYSGIVTISNSTISGNRTNNWSGAGIFINSATVNLSNSTVSGNTSASTGAGFYVDNGTLNLSNVTVTGNSASAGASINTSGVVNITNSTISGNTASSQVGGIRTFAWSGHSGQVTLKNTIVANSTGANCNTTNGGTITDSGGSLTWGDATCPGTNANPLLGALGNYGGPTKTLPLLPGSSAIGAGNAAFCLSSDQRGVTRPSACDIGAFESRGFTLTKTGGDSQYAKTGSAFSNPLTLEIASAFAEPVDGGMVTFTAPGSGASLNPAIQAVTISTGAISYLPTANSIPGVYTVTASMMGAPNVTFSLENRSGPTVLTDPATDITLNDVIVHGTVNANNAVTTAIFEYGLTTGYGATTSAITVTGTTNTAISQAINGLPSNTTYHYRVAATNLVGTNYGADRTFTTSCLAPITVTNNADRGAGSLRQAVADICAGSAITFDNDYAITLASELIIPRSMTINGAGHTIAISGGNAVRVFNVNPGVTFNLQGISVVNGNSDNGAGIYAAGTSSVNILDSAFSGNTAGFGGGIYSSGQLDVKNSTFSDNVATVGFGGGVYVFSGAATVSNSTFSGNSAVFGGGIVNRGATTLTNSTISGKNDLTSSGIQNVQGTFTVQNTLLVQGSGSNCAGVLTGANNLSDDSSCATSAGFARSASIQLGTLGNYGGPTPTIPLLPGSSAFDAGNAAVCPVTDQRGKSRPQGAGCDIGAFEVTPVDTYPLSVTINQASGQGDPTNANPILFTVQFTDPVTGFTSADVLSTAGTVTVVPSGNGTTYTVQVWNMPTPSSVVVSIPAGVAQNSLGISNASPASFSDNSVNYDATRPGVVINRDTGQADPTNQNPIRFKVEFSKPVTGFSANDVILTGTANRSSATQTITGSGTTYILSVSGLTGSGNVIATVPEGVAYDDLNNSNTASSSGDNAIVFDNVRPAIQVLSPSALQALVTSKFPISFDIKFTEPPKFFGKDSLAFSGTAAVTEYSISGSDTEYLLTINNATGGTLIVSIPENKIEDRAGNGNLASPAAKIIIPNTIITKRPAVITPSTEAVFTFGNSVSLPGNLKLEYQCKLDNAIAWSACADRYKVDPGRHTLQARLVIHQNTLLGNIDDIEPTPATYTWSVVKELLKNGSFETIGANKIPTSWVITANYDKNYDKLVSIPKFGTYSWQFGRFTPTSTSKSKYLSQSIEGPGLASDTFTFKLWSKAEKVGSTGLYQVEIWFFNGTIPYKYKPILSFTSDSHPWQLFSQSFKAPGPYTKIWVRIVFSKTAGTAWFDGGSLLLIP